MFESNLYKESWKCWWAISLIKQSQIEVEATQWWVIQVTHLNSQKKLRSKTLVLSIAYLEILISGNQSLKWQILTMKRLSKSFQRFKLIDF